MLCLLELRAGGDCGRKDYFRPKFVRKLRHSDSAHGGAPVYIVNEEAEEAEFWVGLLLNIFDQLDSSQETVEGDVKEIKEDVKAITGKAGKRWDSLVDKALAVLAGAFIAWLLSGVALGRSGESGTSTSSRQCSTSAGTALRCSY